MKRKNRRLASMSLTMCMVLSQIPAVAFAAETPAAVQTTVSNEISVQDSAAVLHTTRTTTLNLRSATKITDTNGTSIDPTTDANGNTVYACDTEGWSYNETTQTLTLSGVNFDIVDTSQLNAILLPTAGTIVLADGTDNRISIRSEGSGVQAVTTSGISGTGSLTVSASAAGGNCTGIYSSKSLTLDACNVTVNGVKTASSTGYTYGIMAASGTITVTPNAAKDNKITVQNVQGNRNFGLYATQGLIAEGGYATGTEYDFISGASLFLRFKDSSTPIVLSFVEPIIEPTFSDAFGNDIDNAASYVKGETKNDKGYTFAGWFDEDGNELADIKDAANGATYTAKWTKDGKTVRTQELDLHNQIGNVENADEGWSWNAESKTLTLSGATFDVLDADDYAVITLPDGATLTTADGTTNTVSTVTDYFSGIQGYGALTVNGSGTLSVTAPYFGIVSSNGDLTINAPVTAKATGENGMAVVTTSDLKLDSSLCIKTPADGIIGEGTVSDTPIKAIMESDGKTYAKDVVIDYASYAITTADAENGTISVEPASAAKGETVTVTVKANEGYSIKDVSAADKDGSKIDLTDNGDGTYSFTMPAGDVAINASFEKNAEPAPDPDPTPDPDPEPDTPKFSNTASDCSKGDSCPIDQYKDTKNADWYHDGIHFALENKLMVGFEDSTFRPNVSTSRAMITTILWRIEGEPKADYAMSFRDVADGQWYTEAVRWAQSVGIIKGYDENTFGVNDVMTREQTMTVLYRYAQYKGYDVSAQADLSSFSDAGKVSNYAVDAVKWVVSTGIIVGDKQYNGDVTLNPSATSTRAQAATMLMRYCTTILK